MTAPIPPIPPTAPHLAPPTLNLPPLPPLAPPTGGYRPPFAPHGPYAQLRPAGLPADAAARAAAAAEAARERSKLGRLTFFAVVMVIGLHGR